MKFLRCIPKAYLSYCIGKLARMPVPWPLNEISIRIFASAYKIDLTTATKSVKQYRSVGDFFTRDLHPHLRPIGEGFVSPVDGRLRCVDIIPVEGTLTQTKGKSYSTGALLGDEELAKRFRGGTCFNFYLSPTDAHHIFAPCAGHIVSTIHIPGKLWPVNNWALHNVEGLFAVNERVVTVVDAGEELVAIVMVGATNVGRIEVSYTPLTTNTAPWRKVMRSVLTHPRPIPVSKGEKIGTFHMGSSVVVLTSRDRALTSPFSPNQTVQYGQHLSK
jgi:phosphatidylserine decarboxylase